MKKIKISDKQKKIVAISLVGAASAFGGYILLRTLNRSEIGYAIKDKAISLLAQSIIKTNKAYIKVVLSPNVYREETLSHIAELFFNTLEEYEKV